MNPRCKKDFHEIKFRITGYSKNQATTTPSKSECKRI